MPVKVNRRGLLGRGLAALAGLFGFGVKASGGSVAEASWIDARDALPEAGRLVLITDGRDVVVGHRIDTETPWRSFLAPNGVWWGKTGHPQDRVLPWRDSCGRWVVIRWQWWLPLQPLPTIPAIIEPPAYAERI